MDKAGEKYVEIIEMGMSRQSSDVAVHSKYSFCRDALLFKNRVLLLINSV